MIEQFYLENYKSRLKYKTNNISKRNMETLELNIRT